MEDLYVQCLEIGRNNRQKESQAQLSQFLRKNSYFRGWEKINTNLDLYTRNYSQFLRFETFPIGKTIYTITPPKQFYIISGRVLVITPKKENSQLLFNNYIERVTKKIKKGNFDIDADDDDCPSKDYYKSQLILKPGDGFGELQYTRSVIIAIDELNVFTCMSNHYQKCFEFIISRTQFITESLSKILPMVDKNEISSDIAPLFIEHSFCSSDDIFRKNFKISHFYLLRQGFCEIYIDPLDSNGQEEEEYAGNQKKAVTIKQGELFGHEDCTGSTNIRIFSCRSNTPNTVIYAIDREAIMGHKNQKIRSLILNNAFSKYHYYMQNFKSKAAQMRQEKNVVIRSPLLSSSGIISSPQPYLPLMNNQSAVTLPNTSSAFNKLVGNVDDKVTQSSNSYRNINSARQINPTTQQQQSDTKSSNTLTVSTNNTKISSSRNGSYSILDSQSNSAKQSKLSSPLPNPPLNLKQNDLKNGILTPKVLSDKKESSVLKHSSQSLHQDSPVNNENKQKTQQITPDKQTQIQETPKNSINLQANIDYIKSLRVSNEPHKFKTASIISYFNPQPSNQQNSLTHFDDTFEENEKVNSSTTNTQNQNFVKITVHHPSQDTIVENRRSSKLGNNKHQSHSSNSRITRSFKLLNEVDDQDSSISFQNEVSIEDDLFKRKLFGGTNLSAYKRSLIAKKSVQNLASQDPNKKELLTKASMRKKIAMFAQTLDKRVRFKGLEEINIENFNNYDDVLPSQQKFSSMSALPELQSPIKSILRKKEDISSHPQVISSPTLNSVKFNTRTLKQLEGITQQRVIPIKKKSLSQKNLIISQINSKN